MRRGELASRREGHKTRGPSSRVSTANSAVSWLIPTLTHALFLCRLNTPYGSDLPVLVDEVMDPDVLGITLRAQLAAPILVGTDEFFFLVSTEMTGSCASNC